MLQSNAQSYFVQVVHSLHYAWLESSAPARRVCEPLKEAGLVSLVSHVRAGPVAVPASRGLRSVPLSVVWGAGDKQFTGHDLDDHCF